MEVSKKTDNKTPKNSKEAINGKPGATEYVNQEFGPKALALISKYNLQTDESYKKLISSFERIESLPKSDPRKLNLVALWEGEFNRIFKHFWENFASGQKRKNATTGISGWRERLDVKPVAISPDQKRKDLIDKLTPGNFNKGKDAKEEILSRAGYVNQYKNEQFNFSAFQKTGQNIFEIENLLNSDVNDEIGEPESFLQNVFTVTPTKTEPVQQPQGWLGLNIENSERLTLDEETELMTNEVLPDPNLLEFINDGKVVVPETKKNAAPIQQNQQQDVKTSSNASDEADKKQFDTGYVARENMSREEFNRENNIFIDENMANSQENNVAVLELGTDFFQKHLSEEFMGNSHVEIKPAIGKRDYNISDEQIVPEKRNIISKDGFELSLNPEKTDLNKALGYDPASQISDSRPYHEENPIGYYPMNYDVKKRPAMHDLMEAHKREGVALDEMTQKIEFLRELRSNRRHRINMMKIERANSYIVARARRLADAREFKRLKRREEFNLKSFERTERLRRLQERQKLIELMKERQFKRTEEKRVATVLKLERERRLERDAKYRTDIASIDAQIRYEQEMIKRTELKMKTYFARIHDDQLFDKSLNIAKVSSPDYQNIEDKTKLIEQLEEQKRKERVEKISRKFVKNIK